MKTLKVLFVLAVIGVISACGPSKDKKNNNITILEETFSDQSKGLDKVKAQELKDAYLEYANLFPDDSLSPEYLFKAADITMNIIDSRQAINIYNRILADYPDFRKAPQCIFLKAFIFENNLNDLVNAKKYYLEFLEKYPEDDFADDAQISLDNLGKSPEELIREFETRLQDSDKKQ